MSESFWLALFGGLITFLVTLVFYLKSVKELRATNKHFARYVEGKLDKQDVKLIVDKKGKSIGVSVTIHPGSINSQAQVSGNVTVTAVPKKPD